MTYSWMVCLCLKTTSFTTSHCHFRNYILICNLTSDQSDGQSSIVIQSCLQVSADDHLYLHVNCHMTWHMCTCVCHVMQLTLMQVLSHCWNVHFVHSIWYVAYIVTLYKCIIIWMLSEIKCNFKNIYTFLVSFYSFSLVADLYEYSWFSNAI